MTASDVLRGWRPRAPTFFARPVLDEDATGGPLCGAELPDRTGCLVWANGGNVRFAHTPDTATWLVDDSVPAADYGTVVATGNTIYGTTVFVAAGSLYAIVSHTTGSLHKIELYVANNVNLPTSWTYKSTIWSFAASGGFFGNPEGTGHPIILASGRWVFASKMVDGVPSSFRAVNLRITTSDDNGTTWTERYFYGHDVTFPRTEFVGAHIGTDPATGNLWVMSGTSISGPAHQIALHRSVDDGTTWTIEHAAGYPYTNPQPIPFLNNGSELWAFDAKYFLTFMRYITGSDGFPDSTGWFNSGTSWVAPGASYYDSGQQRGIVTRKAVYFFMGDQVMRVLGGGWHTGYTGN